MQAALREHLGSFPRPTPLPRSQPPGSPLLSKASAILTSLPSSLFRPEARAVPDPWLASRPRPSAAGPGTWLGGGARHLQPAPALPAAARPESRARRRRSARGAELPIGAFGARLVLPGPDDHPAGGGASPRWRLSGWRAPCCGGFEVVAGGRGARFPRHGGPGG